MTTFHTTFESPVGPLLLISDATSFTGLHTDNDKHRPAVRPDWIRDDSLPFFAKVKAMLGFQSVLFCRTLSKSFNHPIWNPGLQLRIQLSGNQRYETL